jgi:predicted XRE-type DNA-binding protein
MKKAKMLEVKFWLIRQDIEQKVIAKEYGCSEFFVSAFVRGERTSKDLAELLINKGCPKKYFKNGRVAA